MIMSIYINIKSLTKWLHKNLKRFEIFMIHLGSWINYLSSKCINFLYINFLTMSKNRNILNILETLERKEEEVSFIVGNLLP